MPRPRKNRDINGEILVGRKVGKAADFEVGIQKSTKRGGRQKPKISVDRVLLFFLVRVIPYLMPLNRSSPRCVSTLVSRALSSGIMGGGGPRGVCTGSSRFWLSLLAALWLL